MRVVSLVPSVTETLVALGVVPVGCTRFCELAGVPAVGGTKHVDITAVAALAPDLVVVNDEENRVEDARALEAEGLHLHGMSPRSIDDVGPAVCALANAVGVDAPAPFVGWSSWLAATGRAVYTTAFVPIWRRPWMSLASNTYGASLLHHIGVANTYDDASDRYPEVDLADVATRRIDLAILPSEPYDFTEGHAREVRASLPGVRSVLVDGRDLFWWGIRTPEAAARIRKIASK